MKNLKTLAFSVLVIAFIFSACEKTDITEIKSEQSITLKSDSIVHPLCFNQKSADPTVICCRPYKPVCACKNFTFNNECEAKNAGFVNYTEGACKTDICPNEEVRDIFTRANIYCPVTFYVCGCDGKTYDSQCKAIGAGNTSWKPGKCGNIIYELKKHM